MSKTITHRLRWLAITGLVLAFGLAPAARAFLFELGQAKGSFDTTLSVGGLYRLGNPNPQLYGLNSSFQGVTGQADMGILLSFLFFFNMLGAMFLMPALARWLFRKNMAGSLQATAAL